jgi:hypothetical protein
MPTEQITLASPLALSFTLLMGFLLLVLPRRYALVPVIVLICSMPMAPRLLIGGLNFPMVRILVLFGWLRVIIRREMRGIKPNPIDKALIWWALSSVVLHTLLWQTSQECIYRLGIAYDAIGLYSLFRCVVRELEDVIRAFKIMAILAVPLSLAMLQEQSALRNPFAAVFRDIDMTPEVRDEIPRARGPFTHPSLAGTYGASLLPAFVALWPQSAFLAVMGIASSTVITLTSGSSGPIMTYLASVAGLCMWFFRKKMRAVRWGIVLMLFALQCVMKQPVWWAISHMAIIPSSTAWHRSNLIDKAIRHFPEWFLVGTKDTEAWGYYLHDVTNQFVWEGVNGGLLELALFITIIVRCFRGVGRTVMGMENESFAFRFCVWALGAELFSHVVTFFSISYFDQNFVNWYLLLAMISTTSAEFISIKRPEAVMVRQFETSDESSSPSASTLNADLGP